MNNTKPITGFQIFLARIKGMFPQSSAIFTLAITAYVVWAFKLSYWWVLLIPFGVMVTYYILYVLFILGAKLILHLLKKYKAR